MTSAHWPFFTNSHAGGGNAFKRSWEARSGGGLAWYGQLKWRGRQVCTVAIVVLSEK